jgi:Domain of unknown function (DUF6456)
MAPADDTHRASDPSALRLGQLLVLLARRGTVLVAAAQGAMVEVVLEGRDGSAIVGTLDHAVVDQCVQRGWIDSSLHRVGHWSINAAGRAALRKLKSATDDATDATDLNTAPRVCQTGAQPDLAGIESPLAWLRRRKDKTGQPLISAAQFDAGERLRADLWFGEMTPRVTVNWSATGAGAARNASGFGVELLDRTVAAQQRVRTALAAAGPEFSGLLIDVCGHLKGLEEIEMARGWPPRSAKIVLQLGLNALARHYGLIGALQGQRAEGLRHWGSDNYRPHTQRSVLATETTQASVSSDLGTGLEASPRIELGCADLQSAT